MSDPMTLNQRIVLASRPTGAPTPENFRLERVALPDLTDGQVLLKTVYLSLDPYMRGRMSDAPSYAAPVEIGEVMTGGAVSRVERSLNPKFQEVDLVVGATGWQSHSISDGRSIIHTGRRLKLSGTGAGLKMRLTASGHTRRASSGEMV